MKKKILYGLAGVLGLAVVAVAAINSGFPFANQQWTGFGSKRNIVQFVLGAQTNGASSDFYPGVTNTNALGTSSLRFSNVFSTLLNISGASTLTGNTTVGGTLGVTGALTITTATVSGLITMRVNAAPRTNVTPTAVGQLIVNSGFNNELCLSTAAAAASWVKVSTPTAACSN